MMIENAILSFNSLFKATVIKSTNGQGEPKFRATLLIPPDHPQLNEIWTENQRILQDACPSGLPAKGDNCLGEYDQKFRGKDYYDPRCSGWWALSLTAQEDDRPDVVNEACEKIMDPGAVCSGMLVHVNFGMSYYPKGSTGIGGWLNGVMSTGQMGPLGRLDNRATPEQMFASIQKKPSGAPGAGPGGPGPGRQGPGAGPGSTAARPGAPAPARAPSPARPAAVPQRRLTQAALDAGFTFESFTAEDGWTDAEMIKAGWLEPPIRSVVNG